MPTTTFQFFDYEHLPEHLQEVSRRFYYLVNWMEEYLPDCAEKSAGMRKLLEAKDCAVRSVISK